MNLERILLFASLFCFSFGIGLIFDGKKIYKGQLKLSQRIDPIATQNPDRLLPRGGNIQVGI